MSIVERVATSRWPGVGWLVGVIAGTAALVVASIPLGPDWLGPAGAVAIATTYSWALAARTGGRPVVFGLLALACGLGAVLTDEDVLHTGAAVVTCAVASVLAVMLTVPARGLVAATRECLIASVVAGGGTLAVVGFEPALRVSRFEYVTFGLALAGAIVLVYRLGAGLHGLGTRGLLIVVVGGVVVAVTLTYAELLRRYGTPELVESSLDLVRWSRDHLGAFPRPIATVLGVPAIVYGTHMRARRRQGWWVCAFGVAYTSAVANALANPGITRLEAGLSLVYGLVIGILIGFALIRLDRAITGERNSGSGRRASRRSGHKAALRPEPTRAQPLL